MSRAAPRHHLHTWSLLPKSFLGSRKRRIARSCGTSRPEPRGQKALPTSSTLPLGLATAPLVDWAVTNATESV
eukprot:s1720_g5.t1